MQTAKKKPATPTKITTGKVRFSYVHVFQPYAATEGQELKYSVTLLIPKNDKETITKIKSAIEAAKEQGISKWGGRIPANLKLPLRDGDEEKPDRPEFQNMYFVNATSKIQPGIVDRNLQPILDSTEVYSGCWGRASITFYPFNVSGNKGIACGLNHIQKLHDGEFLGGRSKPEDDFEPWEEDDEDPLA